MTDAMAIWLHIARAGAAASPAEDAPARLVCEGGADGEEFDDEDGPRCPCCRLV